MSRNVNEVSTKRVAVDWASFLLAFGRDEDYQAFEQTTYLDLDTGNVLWVYEEDKDASEMGAAGPEDNRAAKLAIASNPSRYLEIPGRSHGEHHEILREFLDSERTTDEDATGDTRIAYEGSIGRWKKAVDQDTYHAYLTYRDDVLSKRATAFLESHGIQPEQRRRCAGPN